MTGAFLLAYAFVPPAHLGLLPVALAALTGPLVIFALPLYAGRWWFDRTAFRPLAVVVACAAIQMTTLAVSPRFYVPPDFGLVPDALITRITLLPLVAGVALLLMILAASRPLPRSVAAAAWWLAISIPLAGLLRAVDPTSAFIDGGVASRYFWLSTGILAVFVIAARPGWTRTATIVLLVVIFARGALIPAHPAAGWEANSSCIGGTQPCIVPVEPTAGWGDNSGRPLDPLSSSGTSRGPLGGDPFRAKLPVGTVTRSPRPAASISQASHHRSAVSSDIPELVSVFRIASRRAWKMRSGSARRAMAGWYVQVRDGWVAGVGCVGW